VKEVLTFSDKNIENVKNIISNFEGEYVLGVGKINDRIVTLLDLKKLIDFAV